ARPSVSAFRSRAARAKFTLAANCDTPNHATPSTSTVSMTKRAAPRWRDRARDVAVELRGLRVGRGFGDRLLLLRFGLAQRIQRGTLAGRMKQSADLL